jgi:receptor protein-tyrosine kinase
MSLIEQAAKRLQELQAAGAELPGTLLRSSADKVQKDTTPTPEAFVRVLEALPPGTAQDLAAAGPPGVHSRVARAPPRHVDINLAELAKRGYVTPEAATSQTADEFRVIKRPIIRNAIGGGGANGKIRNLVMITSALPAEGKTFTALNLAMSVAMEFDSTVLLVDGDVAHPSLPALLGVPNSPGLLDLLTRDDLDVADVLIRTNVEKLTVMPAGSRQRRATELLASEQMANLLRELASRYSDRIIIFDSPPLLPTTEARVLATHMDQIVMVVAADTTTQHTLSQALATIESCEIVLMMLNKASSTDVGAYYGYYAGDEAA